MIDIYPDVWSASTSMPGAPATNSSVSILEEVRQNNDRY